MKLQNFVSNSFFKMAHIGLITYYSSYDSIYKPNRNKLIQPSLLPDIKAGTWSSVTPLPSYRYEFSSAAVGKTIYVVGGIREPSVWFPTSLVEAYDTVTKKWKKVKRLPYPLHHAGVAADNRYLYVAGGDRVRISPSKAVFRYDPSKDEWERLPDMPTKRGALGLAVIGNILYAVGGADYQKKYSLLETLNLATMTWERLPDMLTPREHLAVAVSPLGLHVFGGYNTDRFGSMPTHEIYDPAKKKWYSAPPIPMPICGMMAAGIGDNVYVIGGEQGWAVSKYVFGYNVVKKRWSRCPDLPIARYAGSAAVVKKQIHVIGGCEKMFSHHFGHSHDVFTPYSV